MKKNAQSAARDEEAVVEKPIWPPVTDDQKMQWAPSQQEIKMNITRQEVQTDMDMHELQERTISHELAGSPDML